MDYTLTAIRDQVLTARGRDKRLVIAGGGTKAFYGNPPEGRDGPPCETLDVAAYRGVIDYQPSELVVTVRAGTPLAELEALLAREHQMLAFEPPHFGNAATVGGCVASGLAGPRRVAAGGVRDFVLGARLLDSEARVLRFGGEVMKNVAGYDVARLLAGSLGIFGVVLDVSLKVVPRPLCERTLRLPASEAEALQYFARWRAQPLPISAATWLATDDCGDDCGNGCGDEHVDDSTGTVWLRVSGSDAAVTDACTRIGEAAAVQPVAAPEANAFWTALREQTLPFFQIAPLWRLALPATTPPLRLGATLLEWGGGQRWLAGQHLTAQPLRHAARAAGGHASLFRRAADASAPADGVFQPLAAGVAQITRNLKNEFDPTGLFNPDRLVPGL